MPSGTDYEKAFYRLERNKLWNIVFEEGFTEHTIRAIHYALYIEKLKIKWKLREETII
jgi:hypothetical protein